MMQTEHDSGIMTLTTLRDVIDIKSNMHYSIAICGANGDQIINAVWFECNGYQFDYDIPQDIIDLITTFYGSFGQAWIKSTKSVADHGSKSEWKIVQGLKARIWLNVLYQ